MKNSRQKLCVVEVSKSHIMLKSPETHRWIADLLKRKWPHKNEQIATRKIL